MSGECPNCGGSALIMTVTYSDDGEKEPSYERCSCILQDNGEKEMNELIGNMIDEPEWWVSHLMHTREWLITRLRLITEAVKVEDWDRAKELAQVIGPGLIGYESEQKMYREGKNIRATHTGGALIE